MECETQPFDSDTLEVDSNGFVTGSAFIGCGDYDVSCGVYSYEYERHGERKKNHVPIITVSKPSGKIVAEPESRDSNNPETAIENAKLTAKYVSENLDDYTPGGGN